MMDSHDGTNSPTLTSGVFKGVVLFSVFAAALGVMAVAFNLSGIAMDSARAGSMEETGQWNLLAITDPACIETANQLREIHWGEWASVKAFYPNQATYQWLSGREGPAGYHKDAEKSHRMGSGTFRRTVACVSCHIEGRFDQPWRTGVDLGMNSGYKKAKTREISARAAYDEKRVYLHVRWKSDTDAGGRGRPDSAGPVIAHQTYRFDGKGFADQAVGRVAGPSAIEIDHVDNLKPGSRFNYEDRVAMMSVPAAKNLKDPIGAGFNAHGCFMACHHDMRNMPMDLDKGQKYDFENHPIFGRAGINESDLRHYILRSRDVDENSSPREFYGARFPGETASLGAYLADTILPDIESGNFIDLWQARTGRSIPMGHASADYIHFYRLHNNQYIDSADGWAESGVQNWFDSRPDPDYNNHMPWIYDARKTGFWAIHENDLAAKMRAGHGPLITRGKDQNAVNLIHDDLFAWDKDQRDFRLTRDVMFNNEKIASKGALLGADLLREGDLIPRRALQEARGARSTLQAFGNWNAGVYDVVFVRDRKVERNGEKITDHAFDPDSGHTVAFSVFDDHASSRSHYVTFPLGLIGEHAGKSVYHAHPGVHANTPVILAKRNEAPASREAAPDVSETGAPETGVSKTGSPEAGAPEVNMFAAGAFDHPDNCAACHEEIYDAWSKSMHRFAWENEFYQPDYLKAGRETEGFTDVFCGECHAPVARRTRQLPPPDGSLFDAGSKKGISCDYCHTVKEVVKPVNIETISDPGVVKRGPRGDGASPYHEVEFSEVHTDAAFCGACHNVVHPVTGAIVIDTYDDWKAGPYGREGIRCQDCHMTPGPGVARNPGQSSFMGEDREHVATHFFPGGSVFFHQRSKSQEMADLSRQFLEAAAELEMEAGWTNTGIALTARVKNVGAGHKIPTGVTYIRKMWLEVTLTDDKGKTVFQSGHIAETHHVDPGTVLYRKVFRDADGNLTPKSWLAKEIAYDRRIPAKGYDEQVFEIPAPGDGPYHAVVRLMYRSMSQEMAENIGIEGIRVPAIEMARAELNIAR